MAKRTKTPEQIEWEAGREWRDRFVLGRMNELQREMMDRDEQGRQEPVSAVRRRLFPWRIRVERL
jgi:hypothetical protein